MALAEVRAALLSLLSADVVTADGRSSLPAGSASGLPRLFAISPQGVSAANSPQKVLMGALWRCSARICHRTNSEGVHVHDTSGR